LLKYDVQVGARLLDFELLDAAVVRAEEGDRDAQATVGPLVVELARRRTPWQWVIHGPTEEFRAGVTEFMIEEGSYNKAKRYSCCGRGDVGYAEEHGPGVKVKPMCCGYRVCPRCSRRYGRKILRKVGKHLAEGPHGAIDHIVLTQKVIDGEALDDTRARFEKKWLRVYKAFRSFGMKSMLVTYHVKRTRGEGWHYHAHCVVEWGMAVHAEDACLGVGVVWKDAVERVGELSHPIFYRHVAPPGDAVVEMEADGQSEFWAESEDAVTQLLQYCIRDVVQGIENWIEGVETRALIGEFMRAVDGAKLHRLYGEWRKRVEDVEEENEEDPGSGTEKEKAEARKKGLDGEWLRLGSMDSVLKGAAVKVTLMVEFFQALASSYFNRSAVFRRLTEMLRSIGG